MTPSTAKPEQYACRPPSRDVMTTRSGEARFTAHSPPRRMSAQLNSSSELWSARLCETVARGLRRGINRQRAGEIFRGRRGVSRLKVEGAGVDVSGRLARVAADRGGERRQRAIPLAGSRTRRPEQALR